MGELTEHTDIDTKDLTLCVSCAYQRRVITGRNPDSVQHVCMCVKAIFAHAGLDSKRLRLYNCPASTGANSHCV